MKVFENSDAHISLRSHDLEAVQRLEDPLFVHIQDFSHTLSAHQLRRDTSPAPRCRSRDDGYQLHNYNGLPLETSRAVCCMRLKGRSGSGDLEAHDVTHQATNSTPLSARQLHGRETAGHGLTRPPVRPL